MSTNFYIREASVNTQTGERVFDDAHIGKRAGGWTFMFQGENFKTVQIWRNVISMMSPNMQIVDEYDTPYTPEEFWAAVDATTKPWGPNKIEPKTQRPKSGNEWIDEGFYFYSGEFS
jgi:hypothetical protein